MLPSPDQTLVQKMPAFTFHSITDLVFQTQEVGEMTIVRVKEGIIVSVTKAVSFLWIRQKKTQLLFKGGFTTSYNYLLDHTTCFLIKKKKGRTLSKTTLMCMRRHEPQTMTQMKIWENDANYSNNLYRRVCLPGNIQYLSECSLSTPNHICLCAN